MRFADDMMRVLCWKTARQAVRLICSTQIKRILTVLNGTEMRKKWNKSCYVKKIKNKERDKSLRSEKKRKQEKNNEN